MRRDTRGIVEFGFAMALALAVVLGAFALGTCVAGCTPAQIQQARDVAQRTNAAAIAAQAWTEAGVVCTECARQLDEDRGDAGVVDAIQPESCLFDCIGALREAAELARELTETE